jgi:hypothetical protein
MAVKILEVELGAVIKTMPAMACEEMVEPVLVPEFQVAPAQLQIELQRGWGITG